MNLDEFSQQIARMVERTAALRTAALREDQSRVAYQALEEVRTGVEALHVAEEELRAQHAELAIVNDELEQERKRYRSLFATAPIGYVVTDVAGVVRQCNRVAAAMLGGGTKACVGVPLAMFVTASDRSLYRDLIERLEDSRDEAEVTIVHMRSHHRDGWFRCRLHASVERDPSDVVVSRRFVLVDLATEQLAHDAERLGVEAKRKDEFLAMLAHELRNPLAPIRAAAELWRHHADSLTDEQAKWSIEVISRQADHLAHLVDDLLDVSRALHGKIRLRRARIDLRDVVSEAREATRAPAMRHDIVFTIPDEAVYVDGDSTRLRQIVVNLIENAIKYTPRGRRIDVRLVSQAREACLEVRDQGIGLAPAELESIFAMFQQADAGLTASQGGLGLGLALVRHLAELHGGRVAAHSDGTGKGATFVVHLPRVDPPEESDSPSDSQLAMLRGRKILVVDDNVDAAEMLSTLLTAEGHDTALAYDGAGAIERFESFKPEVVLLDLGLPDLDGLEVARHLRSRSADVLIVAVTGYGDENMRAKSRESGFDHHMLKPIELDSLRNLLLTARRRVQ